VRTQTEGDFFWRPAGLFVTSCPAFQLYLICSKLLSCIYPHSPWAGFPLLSLADASTMLIKTSTHFLSSLVCVLTDQTYFSFRFVGTQTEGELLQRIAESTTLTHHHFQIHYQLNELSNHQINSQIDLSAHSQTYSTSFFQGPPYSLSALLL
jgi:hypothetical protein